MAKIHGVLLDPFERPMPDVTIELEAKETSPTVLANTKSERVTDSDGNYSFNVGPGLYSVRLYKDGHPRQPVGAFRVFADSKDDDLNHFLGLPMTEMAPAWFQKFQDAQQAARQSQYAAKQSAEQSAQNAENAHNSATAARASKDAIQGSEQRVREIEQITESHVQQSERTITEITQLKEAAASSASSANEAAFRHINALRASVVTTETLIRLHPIFREQ